MIEVLKQMVEALEWCHGGEPIGTAEAIQAGKQAIAELESQEPDKYEMDIECTKCGAKQSGVLTVNTHPPQRTEERNFCPRCGKRTNDIHTCTPPQRTWVGLTDEEIYALESVTDTLEFPQTVRAIEAKIKERNGQTL